MESRSSSARQASFLRTSSVLEFAKEILAKSCPGQELTLSKSSAEALSEACRDFAVMVGAEAGARAANRANERGGTTVRLGIATGKRATQKKKKKKKGEGKARKERGQSRSTARKIGQDEQGAGGEMREEPSFIVRDMDVLSALQALEFTSIHAALSQTLVAMLADKERRKACLRERAVKIDLLGVSAPQLKELEREQEALFALARRSVTGEIDDEVKGKGKSLDEPRVRRKKRKRRERGNRS